MDCTIVSEPIHPLFDPAALTDQEQVRLANLQALRDAGIDPYPARSVRTHTMAAARAFFAEGQSGDTPVSVAGRIRSVRSMGKLSFVDLEDGTGRIQLIVRAGVLQGPVTDEVLKKRIDLGDHIGATGKLTLSKTGELSVEVQEIQFLSKTLKPMPDKWKGMRDAEKRYRRRYVDLLANAEVREIFRIRARIVSALRDYFDRNDFIEVETPILQPIYGGAAARPFVTHHNQLHQDLYLRISFELYLKRLLVGGFDRVYEIGRDFRNEGVSFKHNPEFTQLEFYEAYADYNQVMQRTEEMICHVARQVHGSLQVPFGAEIIDFTPPWPRLRMRDAILQASGIDYEAFPNEELLRTEMRRRGLDAPGDLQWGKLVDKLMSAYVEPTLIQPVFITDHPRDVSPLAKGSPVNPLEVERFEAYVCGMEFCNAFSELNDPIDQLQRFIDENYRAALGDDEAHPIDEDFIEALTYGMPPAGGFGMGVDRITMIFANKSTIREVLLFPHLRAIKEEDEAEDEGAA